MEKGITRCRSVVAAFALAAFAASSAFAASRALPPIPAPEFADAEASTNVAFNAVRSDARVFAVELHFNGGASNCVQVAFGRDADRDGDLSPEEMGLVLGWRGGSYFVEDAQCGTRVCEDAAPSSGGPRFLRFAVSMDDAFRPRAASATNETGACFADVSASPPPWLYDPGWNLMKATSRGPVAASESLSVDCRYRHFCVEVW